MNYFGMVFNGLVKFKDLTMGIFSILYNLILIKKFRKFRALEKMKT